MIYPSPIYEITLNKIKISAPNIKMYPRSSNSQTKSNYEFVKKAEIPKRDDDPIQIEISSIYMSPTRSNHLD